MGTHVGTLTCGGGDVQGGGAPAGPDPVGLTSGSTLLQLLPAAIGGQER